MLRYILVFSLILLEISTCESKDLDLIVVATGHGPTASVSQADALRSAIQMAVGVTVISDTKIENDKIIKDEQIEYSAGLVKEFKVLNQYKDKDGLYITSVRALVNESKAKAVIENKAGSRVIDGNSLGAKLRLEASRAEEKNALFNHIFDNFYDNVFSANIVSFSAESATRDNAIVSMATRINLSESSLKALEGALTVIAKTTGAIGKDVFIHKGWGRISRADFDDNALTAKLTIICGGKVALKFDFIDSSGSIIDSKLLSFNPRDFVTCNQTPDFLPTGSPRSTLYINATQSHIMLAKVELPIDIIERIKEIKIMVVSDVTKKIYSKPNVPSHISDEGSKVSTGTRRIPDRGATISAGARHVPEQGARLMQ